MADSINRTITSLIAARVYNDSKDLIGIADVDLPEITPMTATVSGAGIAGEAEFPVMGHYQSATVTIHWKGLDAAAFDLSKYKAQPLEIRGSQQVYDAGTGELKSVPVRVALRAVPKSLKPGSFKAGERVETETELEVLYLKIEIEGKEICEIDKFNYICRIGGDDAMSQVRNDLGLN